jgi:hypothetical protein
MRRPAALRGSRRFGEPCALFALWLGAATGLQLLTTRVADWFVMTDELLYERLAISIARGHSPLPRVHGTLVPSVDQLYPLLVAPVFGDSLVPHSLHAAHLLNAFVICSACLPAYLLARRVTGRGIAAWFVALATLCVPWLVLSSFLLTEVAAYPAFLWAVYALQVALDEPSRRHDALALLGIALAVSARTQFVVLVVVFPLALLALEGRGAPARHRLVAWAYGVLLVGAVILLATGRTASALGTYGSTLRGNLLPTDSGRSFAEHAAVVALGLGLLPFVVGVAWLLANAMRRNAFAVLATVTVLAVLTEVTIFDLRFGGGIVRDRYLFYVAPLVLAGFACALLHGPWPRWSLVAPLVLVAVGLGAARLPRYDKLNVDTPVSVLDDVVLRSMHSLTSARAFLVVTTVVLVILFLQGAQLLRRSHLAVLLALLTLAVLPAEAAYAWVRLFRVPDTAGRPLTHPDAERFTWLDEAVGPGAEATLVPYPTIPGDYWASVGSWWDLEFWNTSAARAAYYPGQFEETPSTFPKLRLRFDERSGAANLSPTQWVVLSAKETRFRISGTVRAEQYNVLLVDAARPWRTDWLTFGLTDDGWTKPGVVAHVRVFASPGQRTAVSRTLSLAIRPPESSPRITFTVRSNVARWQDDEANAGTVVGSIRVCVPRTGYADVRISTPLAAQTYGDMRDASTFGFERRLGVFLSSVALADEIGGPCRP